MNQPRQTLRHMAARAVLALAAPLAAHLAAPRAASLAAPLAASLAAFLAFLAFLPVAGSVHAQAAAAYDYAFERDLFKTRFEHEVEFRAAAIHVAWGAEALCDQTTQVEPFVLLSQHAIRRRMSSKDIELFRQATGMDDKWRVVWTDEAAPEEMKLGSAVTAINGRKLPGGGTKFEFGALFRGGSVVSNDDGGFWDVMLKARAEAAKGTPMTVTLESGETVVAETQTGCAGSVTASSFDSEPDAFWRQGTVRAKIPANAMLEANTRDEFRWLAAFGTYFQASKSAIEKVQQAEGVSNGFVVGKILTMTLPGMGMLLTAVEAQAEKTIVVDSIVGNADLFANEVVASLGGDPTAGMRLSERMAGKQMKVDAVLMGAFRLSNAAEHARRIKLIQQAQADEEKRQTLAQEEAQRQPLPPPSQLPALVTR